MSKHPMSDDLRTHAGTEILKRDANYFADELDRLNAIVERLPVTADGVRIYPGMKVWFAGCSEPIEADPGVDTVYDDETYQHRSDTVYSTREAAEAARNKETTDE